MGNKRFQKHKGGGAKTGHKGPKRDSVSPIKTKMWPGIPGKTQPGGRNQGIRKIPGGAAEKGL